MNSGSARDFDQDFQAALALHRGGRLAEARHAYAALLAVAPDHPDLRHLCGVSAAQAGDMAAGVRFMAQAAGLNPDAASYRDNLQKAVRRLEPAALADAFTAAADFLADHRRGMAAAGYYRLALALCPDRGIGWFNLGIVLRDDRQPSAALAAFRRAGALMPALVRADFEMGGVCYALQDFAGARRHFARVLEREPENDSAWMGLANAVKASGAYGAAVDLYRRALTVQPARTDGWFNMGVTLADEDRLDPAINAYRHAVVADPNDADIHYNLAHQLLLTGQYIDGWREFEWRFKRGIVIPDRGRPRWNGEPLAGRTLLLYGEQGHGDTLQFIRYATLAATRGGPVVVECPPALVRLMASVPGVAAAYPLGQAPAFDLICPLMSLPMIFATELASIPDDTPYMASHFPGDERFDQFFADDDPLRVGLVWAGEPRPQFARLAFADGRRSVPLAGLAPLLAIPGVKYYSLQMGVAAGQARAEPFAGRLIDPMGTVKDFADTACIVRRLDLVISVCTSVAHLAGGLGCPLWLLHRYDGCWRWLMGREDSPWYPNARIFRQTRLADWQPVFDGVAQAMGEWAATTPPGRRA